VIGIIMPQLNVLPVNVSQNIELKDENPSFDSTTSKDDFAKYIDLHLSNNKESGSKRKIDSNQSETDMAKDIGSSTKENITSKKINELAETGEANEEVDSLVPEQEIAASGNKEQIESNQVAQKSLDESEQLMSFLTKADNTLLNQSAKTSSPESLSTEQKAHYEAQLLLNSSNLVADLSAVAKALGNDQTSTSLAPTLAEQVVSADEALLNSVTKGTGEDVTSEKGTKVKLSGELLIEGKSKNNKPVEVSVPLVKSAENKAAVLPEMETAANSNSEVKISYATDSKTNAVLSGAKAESTVDAKTNTTQKTSNETLSAEKLIDRELMSKKNEETTLIAEQKVTKQISTEQTQMSSDKATQNSLSKEAVQSHEAELLNRSQLSDNTLSESNNKNKAPSDAVKPLEKILETQVNTSKEGQPDKVSSLPDSQITKKEIGQNNETKEPTEKANQTPTQLTKNTLSNNQSVTNDLIQENVDKTQAKNNDKTHLSSVLVDQIEQSQVKQKQVAENDDGVLIEGKVIEKDRINPSINRHVIDINGNSIRTPQEVIDQQSAEMLNPSVATEVSQSQKTNAQLHQETISLFRKDFTEAVKDKVMLMISQKLQQFDITLDPPELGNMQVRVNLQGEQAVVSFLVQSQQTKDALEQNMHKLRELLAEQGVDVGDANVEQQSQQSSNEEGFTAENKNEMGSEIGNMAEENDVVSHTLSAKMIDSSTATVDYYA
jgi:flagellar hook-length control protein FliK